MGGLGADGLWHDSCVDSTARDWEREIDPKSTNDCRNDPEGRTHDPENPDAPRSRSSLRGRRIPTGLAGLLVCSALAVLLLGAAACSSTRPPGQQFDDATLASEVDAELGADPDVSAANIDVDVQDGMVTLSGLVNSETARTQAERVARGVDGVRRVINEIRVS